MVSFEIALTEMKNGQFVARECWNTQPQLEGYPKAVHLHNFQDLTFTPMIIQQNADSEGRHMPWSPSQDDLMAVDWIILTTN